MSGGVQIFLSYLSKNGLFILNRLRELPEKTSAVYTANVEEKETLVNRLNINRFRNLQFLLNTTARILKLYKIYKRTETNLTNIKELTSDDVNKAEYFWIKAARLELIVYENPKIYEVNPEDKG